MSKTSCQCAPCACPAEAMIEAALGASAVSHNHALLPSVLRYRGLEKEALMAARLVEVETFIATLRSVLDRLEGSMVARIDSPSRPPIA